MNDGVKILLERMKTHPEEFVGVNGFAYSKWGSVLGSYKEFLEKEDQQALDEALNALLQQRFTEIILEELVDPKDGVSLKNMAHPRNTPSVGQTQGAYTANASGTITSWENREPLTQTQKEQKSHKTIFGKLFNYQ